MRVVYTHTVQCCSALSGLSLENFPLKKFIFSKKVPWTFWPQPSKIFLEKKFSYFFLKKAVLKNALIFLPKSPTNSQETELSYISRKVYLEP